MEVKRFPHLHDRVVEVVTNLLVRRLPSTNEMVIAYEINFLNSFINNSSHIARRVSFQISILTGHTYLAERKLAFYVKRIVTQIN